MTSPASQSTYSGAFNFAFVDFKQNQVDAGNITANQFAGYNADNNVVVKLEGHTEFFALDHGRIGESNRGDYHVRAGGATNDFTRGVFIASIAQNGVDWGFDDGTEYGAAVIGVRGDNSMFVSLNNSFGNEYNANISVANFDFERYIGAWIRDNGKWITTGGRGTSKIHTQRQNDASYTVKIDGVNSLTDGVLLITGAENRAQYGAARPLADGSGWVIDVHDNNVDGYANTGYEYGFTFIPKGDAYTTFGRVLSDGSSTVSNGNYTINKIGVGEYELFIDGKTPKDGALVVKAEGLDGANIDNVVSYQPMADGKGWIVQTRDFPSGKLEDAGASIVPEGLEHMNDAVDPDFTGASIDAIIDSYQDATDGNSLIAAHRAGYWENNKRILPENSIASIERSIELGVDIVEVDVRKTKDGHYIIMHDDTIDRTTSGSGWVSDLTLEQIRQAHLELEGTNQFSDEVIATLEEILAAIDDKVMVNLDKVNVDQFAEVTAIAAAAGVADQIILKAAINNEGDIANIKAALAASAPGVHFMPIMYPGISPDLVAKAFAELHPDAVEINVGPNSHGWVDNPGWFFTPEMKALFDQNDVRYFINTLFAGQDNGDGSMSGGRGDFVALGRPDLVYGWWADQGVSIFQTDETRIAANYLNTYGYRNQLEGSGPEEPVTGTPGNDMLKGTAEAEEIFAGAGDDVVQGLGGDDKLHGEAGNDTLIGGEGNDELDGGEGDDVLTGETGDDHLLGGAGNDMLDGGEGDDTLEGGAGSDIYTYRSGDGSDAIVETEGDEGDIDTLFLDDANRQDVTIRRNGNDIELTVGDKVITLKDQLAGNGAGVEIVAFADGTSLTAEELAAAGNHGPVAVADTGSAVESETKVFDLVANDTDEDQDDLTLTGFDVTSVGGIELTSEQAKEAFSIDADGKLAFNPGDLFESLTEGETATVTLSYKVSDGHGGEATGTFTLNVSGEGRDLEIVTGTAGSDVLVASENGSAIDAGAGNDYVFGAGAGDVIEAGAGNDYVLGNGGDDVINGGAGHDTLFGGDGDDSLIGGAGNDRLVGGAGNDTFVFATGFGSDTVMDFADGDVIDVVEAGFADFADLSAHMTDTAFGATLTLDDGSAITLANISKATLSADDFLLAA